MSGHINVSFYDQYAGSVDLGPQLVSRRAEVSSVGWEGAGAPPPVGEKEDVIRRKMSYERQGGLGGRLASQQAKVRPGRSRRRERNEPRGGEG